MEDFEYNFELLKATRESKKITAHSIAVDLCLAERHIKSIEENSLQYFASESGFEFSSSGSLLSASSSSSLRFE